MEGAAERKKERERERWRRGKQEVSEDIRDKTEDVPAWIFFFVYLSTASTTDIAVGLTADRGRSTEGGHEGKDEYKGDAERKEGLIENIRVRGRERKREEGVCMCVLSVEGSGPERRETAD